MKQRAGSHAGVQRVLLVLAFIAAAVLCGCSKSAPDEVQKHLQERMIAAKTGDIIELPAGKFHFERTLSLTVSGVTLRGKGMDRTILSFAGQKTGAQGVLVKANDFVVEDLAVEDTAGDALTIQGGTNVTVRRVRTEWTRGPNENNGPYGIYPVDCKNLLVEDSVARAAADAGIYVGQSENVVIRRNRSELNVDGYEIENSENVDAYENVATHNTGGIGVFNLPNLPRQGGRRIRVFNNQIVDNNSPNFAPKSLGPIATLPSGTGMYVLAIRDVEVFKNAIRGNNTVNVYIMHYNTAVDEEALAATRSSALTQQIFAPQDKRFYPFVQDVWVHDNEISGGGQSPDLRMASVKALAQALHGKLRDVLYDGMVDPSWGRKGMNPGRICLQNNGPATFLNFDAAGGLKHTVSDLKNYACSLAPLGAVVIPQLGTGANNGTGGRQ
jgi:parallel beta-helix repeat protein